MLVVAVSVSVVASVGMPKFNRAVPFAATAWVTVVFRAPVSSVTFRVTFAAADTFTAN